MKTHNVVWILRGVDMEAAEQRAPTTLTFAQAVHHALATRCVRVSDGLHQILSEIRPDRCRTDRRASMSGLRRITVLIWIRWPTISFPTTNQQATLACTVASQASGVRVLWNTIDKLEKKQKNIANEKRTPNMY